LINAPVREELAKAGFRATQGVAAAAFRTVESIDGERTDFSSRQKIVAIDAVLTEKRSRRSAKGLSQETAGLYVGPITVVRHARNSPALIADVLPYSFWTSTRLSEFAVEEKKDFPHAQGGRLVARIAYEDRYADGELAATGRGRVRCDVTKVVPAASIDARLSGLAAQIDCSELLEVEERHIYARPAQQRFTDRNAYSHWYILDRGWSIAVQGEYPVRAPGLSFVRKWSSKLVSFD